MGSPRAKHLRIPVSVALFVFGAFAHAQDPLPVTSPREAFGFNIGDDYAVVSYSQMEAYRSEEHTSELQSH